MANDIIKSFKEAIMEPAAENFSNVAEFSIDLLIKNESLKDFPIVGQIFGLYKTGVGIKEFFMVKKILKFLNTLQDIPQEEKEDFVHKLSENESIKNEVFEKLIIILDRFDDTEKAIISGNLFKACIKGEISLDAFFRLASIIDRAFVHDIKDFCLRRSNEENNKNFVSLGLLKEEIEVNEKKSRHTGLDYLDYVFKYQNTKLALSLIQYGFNE
jgi:hypothetical protein